MTATTKPAAVYEALMARVATIDTGLQEGSIAYPEAAETYTPPADGKYLEVRYFPNSPLFAGLASGKVDQGILLINVIWPKNVGIAAAMEVVGAIEAHFPPGHRMTSGAFGVKVSGHPFVVPPLHDADRLRIPVTVPWAA